LVLLHKVVIVLEYQQIDLINNNIKQNIIMMMINRYNNNRDKQINNKYIYQYKIQNYNNKLNNIKNSNNYHIEFKISIKD
jgi:hypothetical protein